MEELVALEGSVDIERLQGEEAGNACPNGAAGPGARDVGLPLIDLEAAKESSLTLEKMSALFRVTTGLELYLFCRSPSTGAWKEYGFNGTIQMPHFCQLVRSTPEGLARCTASHLDVMGKVKRHPHLVHQRCHASLISFHLPVFAKRNGLACIQTTCALPHGYGPREFWAVYEKVADLGLLEKQMLNSIETLTVVSTSTLERVAEWLELFSRYLAEISGVTLARGQESDPPAKQPPIPLQEQIREKIGRYVVLPDAQGNRSRGCSAALIEQVAAFLDEYYYLPLSTELIAWAIGFEPSYFGKTFKKQTNTSLAKYLRHVRLFRAKRLLEDPYLSIAEIANRTGFSDASYFTRVFRSSFGITPSRFRDITEDRPDGFSEKVPISPGY